MMSNKTHVFSAFLLLSLSAATAYVEELDGTFMETKGDGIWLIKFYAPWCAFCKKLDPIWHEIGSELKSQGSYISVGKVDGTAHTNVAKEYQIRGYPSIIMLKKDMKYEYQGPRTKSDIMDFVNRISGPEVKALTTTQLFQHMMSRHDVLFIYVGASSPLKSEFVATAKQLVIHSNFFSASRDILPKAVNIPKLPAVAVFKDGTYYTYDEERDGNLTAWINRERFLSYFKIDSFTLYAMGDTGKLVALALVDEDAPSEKNLRYKALVEKTATEYYERYNKHYHFGYMEGNEYVNGLIMGEVALPSILVLNVSNDSYFFPPRPVDTEEALLEFLTGVLNNSVKSQGGNGLLERVKRLIYDFKVSFNEIYTKSAVIAYTFVLILVCLPLVVVSLLCYIFCKNVGVEDDEEPLTRTKGRKGSKQTKALSGEAASKEAAKSSKKPADKKDD